jgi:hypothetical protein
MRTAMSRWLCTVLVTMSFASRLFAAESDFAWVTIGAEGRCEIKGQRLDCPAVPRYLQEQLRIPLTYTVYVNFYRPADRKLATSTAKIITDAGYQTVEITSVGFVKEEDR